MSSSRHSLCHGWSAGVIDYLFSRVLGVRLPGLGSDPVVVKPYLGFGDMEGVIPIAGGEVRVAVRGGKVEADSKGVKIELRA